MKFNIAETINHPLVQVYTTYRDRLPELVPYMPNVDRVQVLERADEPGRVRLLNLWQVSAAIPRAVRPFFPGKALEYRDHARWDDARWLVNWRLEIGLFPDAVTCQGTNYFKERGPGATEVLLSGDLGVDLARIPGVPRLLRGLGGRVESFVLERVRPNLSAVTHAVARFLDEGGAPGTVDR